MHNCLARGRACYPKNWSNSDRNIKSHSRPDSILEALFKFNHGNTHSKYNGSNQYILPKLRLAALSLLHNAASKPPLVATEQSVVIEVAVTIGSIVPIVGVAIVDAENEKI